MYFTKYMKNPLIRTRNNSDRNPIGKSVGIPLEYVPKFRVHNLTPYNFQKFLRCEVMNSEFWNIFQWNSNGLKKIAKGGEREVSQVRLWRQFL